MVSLTTVVAAAKAFERTPEEKDTEADFKVTRVSVVKVALAATAAAPAHGRSCWLSAVGRVAHAMDALCARR